MNNKKTYIFAVLILIIAAIAGSPALLDAGQCPQPRVYVQEFMPDNTLEDQAQMHLRRSNRGAVRFLLGGEIMGHRKFFEESTGISLHNFDDYILTSGSSESGTITLTLRDNRGRLAYTASGTDPIAVAEAMSPLLEKIRSHQRKIRREEHTAIRAWIYTNPKSAQLEEGEQIEIQFELIDCDGYVLANRVVEIEIAGPGEVKPTRVTTDNQGKGSITYTATRPGRAAVYLWYTYDVIDLVGTDVARGDNTFHIMIQGQAARSRLQLSGDGYTVEYDVWNCHGLEGYWQMRGELTLTGYGTISGETEFYMLPRPEDADTWESEPFSYTMSGTLRMQDVRAEVKYEFRDIVASITVSEDGAEFNTSSGTAKGTVTVIHPEFTHTQSHSTTSAVARSSAPIVFEKHPSCE